ncbi:unnamed protein product, partial [Plutella xylostella]
FSKTKFKILTKTNRCLFQFNIPEMLVVFAVSVLATVAIEMPFNEVYRIYFGKSQTKLKDK